ncbi:MAG: hypothetical protein ABW148_16265, partial [Sedimenticola sp.]
MSKALIQEGGIPKKALDDALHVAIAAVQGIDFLLTWNCRHIDNAEMKTSPLKKTDPPVLRLTDPSYAQCLTGTGLVAG